MQGLYEAMQAPGSQGERRGFLRMSAHPRLESVLFTLDLQGGRAPSRALAQTMQESSHSTRGLCSCTQTLLRSVVCQGTGLSAMCREGTWGCRGKAGVGHALSCPALDLGRARSVLHTVLLDVACTLSA